MGNIRHIEDLKHCHPHDGRGYQADALKAPALGIFFNVGIQFRRMLTDAADQTADIEPLLFVGQLVMSLRDA